MSQKASVKKASVHNQESKTALGIHQLLPFRRISSAKNISPTRSIKTISQKPSVIGHQPTIISRKPSVKNH